MSGVPGTIKLVMQGEHRKIAFALTIEAARRLHAELGRQLEQAKAAEATKH